MHTTNIYQRIKLITNICWPKKQVMQTKKMIKNIILENQLCEYNQILEQT